MIHLKKHITHKMSVDTKVIASVDVSKALDNVQHEALLKNPSSLNVGIKTYNYVRDFLSKRTSTISMAQQLLKNMKLGDKEKPQES